MLRLFAQLTLTPFSRIEHECCKRAWAEGIVDPVERARCFLVLSYQSYSCIFGETHGTSGTKSSVTNNVKNRASAWMNRVDQLPELFERLRDVQVESLDFRKLIPKYDGPHVWTYMDPPYVHSTRTAHQSSRSVKKYTHELSDDDHVDLLGLANRAKGMMMISGYRCPLYDQRLKNWNHYEKVVQMKSATTLNMNVGAQRRTEVVWTNYDTRLK